MIHSGRGPCHANRRLSIAVSDLKKQGYGIYVVTNSNCQGADNTEKAKIEDTQMRFPAIWQTINEQLFIHLNIFIYNRLINGTCFISFVFLLVTYQGRPVGS